MLMFIAGALAGWLFMTFVVNNQKDDTDTEKNRSGMRLHTDYRTGYQYVSAMGGGITPRINSNGEHMKVDIEGK
jgi:hypothetical protein